MAMDLLNKLVSTRLPVTFTAPADVDKVKLLQAAGLVVALAPAPTDPLLFTGTGNAAQVLAITERGWNEFHRNSPGYERASASRRLRKKLALNPSWFAFKTRASGGHDERRAKQD